MSHREEGPEPAADRLSAYTFELPADLIAQEPLGERDGSRLLALPRAAGPVAHAAFRDLPELLAPGDLLILNDTRVLPARVLLCRASGGKVRGLLLEVPHPPRFRLMLEGKGRLAEGASLAVAGGVGSIRLGRDAGGGVWEAEADGESCAALLASGRMPLPPYIKRERGGDARDAVDRERYQTVFARELGAVAAPTAGLHFTPELLSRLAARGVATAAVTLHVGLGTFLPVRVDALSQHAMHAEAFRVPEATVAAIRAARERGGRAVAVGTTVARALESAARGGELVAASGSTDLFIRPPFEFRAVDGLLTNFHLPGSTLLVLVAAFAGRERVLAAYREAVAQRYRFFSYGDAMLLL